MAGNCNHVCRICRCGECAVIELVCIVIGSRNQKKTVCIVAACCTYCINESLVNLHDYTVIQFDFIDGLENQLFIVISEILSNSLPQSLELREAARTVNPTCFVMRVDNNIHIVLIAIINNFLNTSNPLRVRVAV